MTFPHYTQLEFSDCGPVCLRIILKYYGKECDIDYIRQQFEITRMGVTLGDIAKAADNMGFETMGISATIEGLEKNCILPCILFWRNEHFVVLYKITNDYYYLSDPAFGKHKVKAEEFQGLWKGQKQNKGLALFLQPRDEFYNTDFPRTTGRKQLQYNWKYLRRNIKGFHHYVFIIFILLTLSSLLGYVLPQTMQSLVDKGIENKAVSIIWPILGFQLSLLLGQFLLQAAENWLRIRLSMGISIKMMTELLYKLIKLPIRFFDNKVSADIYQRIEDQSRIEKFISEQLIQTLFAIILSTILLIRMMKYNLLVAFGFIIFTMVSMTWTVLFNNRRKQLDYSSFHLAAENRNLLGELLLGMVEIKMNNAQIKKVAQWLTVQKKVYNLKIRTLQVGVYQTLGVQFISHLKAIGGTVACSYLVIEQQMSIGEMISVGYIIGMLGQPLDSLLGFTQYLLEAKLSMERLEIIKQVEDENVNASDKRLDEIQTAFEFKNVCFKYNGSFQPYVIQNLTTNIEKGKVTAIVGESGSGKTTLLKLLLGFYKPQIGEIYLNNFAFNKVNCETWREKCGVVMQDGYIFSGTIADNISIFEENPSEERLRNACEIACIWDFVNKLPMKLETKIGSIGFSISGGQRQRLLIARAVYKNPEFLFLDEATSSLDANNEKNIIENLSDFFSGKTVVIIAHRLSTVKSADKIIVLENGRAVEQGNHSRLTKDKGLYFSLIKNQLELGT